MINYEIKDVKDKLIDGKVCCIMFISVEGNNGFTIEFELGPETLSKEFIEGKIKEKMVQIASIRAVKKDSKYILEEIRRNFIGVKGTL